MDKETVEFAGVRYQRFPNSPHKHLQRYYWPDRTGRKNGIDSLHREIWKATHGPIPTGCLIHHRDENWLNNAVENLECVTRKQHAERHPEGSPAWLVEHLDAIRPKASEWHRSEEGREWHRQHGKQSWVGRAPTRYVCGYCHEPFETVAKRYNVRFCSRRCGQLWYQAHGVYAVQKVCEICATSFRTSKFKPARCCGKKCAAQMRLREGTAYRGGRPK